MNTTLFDLPPAAAKADPFTSHLAADEVTASGRRAAQCKLVAELVWKLPASTSAELANVFGVDRHMVARRLPDCERLGMVSRGPARTCEASGRQAIVWNPKGN